jgi:prepilin-type processing-associated H-X9-DG protein
MKRNDNRNKWKFTLLELLIVTAIIMILISILLPALSRAKEAAKGINCASNLKQLYIPISLYRDDFRGVIFQTYRAPGFGETTWPKMYGVVLDYIQNNRLYSCPSDPCLESVSGVMQYRAYGIVDYDTPDEYMFTDPSGYYYFLRCSKVRNPAHYYIFADSLYGMDNSHSPGEQAFHVRKSPTMNLGGVYPRHCNAANVLFLDGHAKACRSADLQEIGFTGEMKNLASIIYY